MSIERSIHTSIVFFLCAHLLPDVVWKNMFSLVSVAEMQGSDAPLALM